MNISLMIIVSLVACVCTLIVFGFKSYKQLLAVKGFVQSMKPKVKTATTIPELLHLNDIISEFALIQNSFKLKSFLYRDAKLLLIAVNSKIELLDRL